MKIELSQAEVRSAICWYFEEKHKFGLDPEKVSFVCSDNIMDMAVVDLPSNDLFYK